MYRNKNRSLFLSLLLFGCSTVYASTPPQATGGSVNAAIGSPSITPMSDAFWTPWEEISCEQKGLWNVGRYQRHYMKLNPSTGQWVVVSTQTTQTTSPPLWRGCVNPGGVIGEG